MSENLVQYSRQIIVDDANEVIRAACEVLKIEYISDKYCDALDCNEYGNPDSVCIFRDVNDSDRFVMLDTLPPGEYFFWVIQFRESEIDKVKKEFIPVLNKVYEPYNMSVEDLKNSYNDEHNHYNFALRRYNVKSF